MESRPIVRVVAIVGRPNVGKSALFNRIAGRRVAIVHEASGVTRDRLIREVTWQDERFELIDTGGIGLLDGAGIAGDDAVASGIRDQARAAIEDAAVILFVTDVTAGALPLDQEVAALLHASGRTVLLAANKADHEGLARGTAEFARFGFPVFPVSALHNLGIAPLLAAVLPRLPEAPPPEAMPQLKVAVVGRPNAGKSSYINRLLRSDRVIVSPVPGTTRDSIEVPFRVGQGPSARHYLLIDTAGIRQARRMDSAVAKFSLIRAEESIAAADVCALMLDGPEGPTQMDKKIAAGILERRRGCLVFVNKWDLLDDTTMTQYEKAFRRAVPFLAFAPVVFLSAKTGLNVRRSIEAIDHVAAQISLKLPTGVLNRVLHAAVARVQPPMVQGKRLKFYYAAQVGAAPQRIRLFVNDPARITAAYELYLIRCLRQQFGLEGAPIFLEPRSSHQRHGEDSGSGRLERGSRKTKQ